MMKIKLKKKQHIVPKQYLRAFANDKEQVWVFDRAKMQAIGSPVHINDIPTRRYFYDFSESFMRLVGLDDPQHIENRLSEIESKSSEAIKKFRAVAKTGEAFEQKDFDNLLKTLSLQYSRTKFARDRFTRIMKEFFLRFGCKVIKPEGANIVPSETMMAYIQAKFMQEMIPGFVKRWGNLNLCMGKASCNCLLMTSDNPVSFSPGFIDEAVRENLPVDTNVLFPLDSEYLIILTKKANWRDSKKPQIINLTEKDVHCHNFMQLAFCSRHLISKDGDFSFIKKVNTSCFTTVEEVELYSPKNGDILADLLQIDEKTLELKIGDHSIMLPLKNNSSEKSPLR